MQPSLFVKALLLLGCVMFTATRLDTGLLDRQRLQFVLQPIENDEDANVAIPTNLSIVFVGDSLSRFTYMSLVHFLRHGDWVDRDKRWFLEVPPGVSAEGRNQHARRTTADLAPYEFLDTYRSNETVNYAATTIENRYYVDTERGNYVTYLSKLGPFSVKGHLDAPHVLELAAQHHSVGSDLNDTCDHRHLHTADRLYPLTWEARNYEELIRNYVSQLIPKPGYIIFNEGVWKGHELFRARTVLPKILKVLNENNITGVYRTTTFMKFERGLPQTTTGFKHRHDFPFCRSPTLRCVNVSWTADLPESAWMDVAHFRYDVYNRMVKQLLAQLNVGFE